MVQLWLAFCNFVGGVIELEDVRCFPIYDLRLYATYNYINEI